MPLHIATPLIASSAYRQPGRELWLKMEALQPCGSFKMRGIGHACETHAARGARRLMSSSGGNAGLAVAYAGRMLGLPVTVVVPETTLPRAKELIRREGAQVLVHGGSWMEANAHLQSLLGEGDAFIHPFDDPLLWTGHASLVHEVAQAGLRPDAVVLSVGGGGLLCGVIEGLHAQGWTDVPVVAVETDGADSLAQAMVAGHAVQLPAITSIATSLGARQVCARAVERTHEHPVRSVVVSDLQAVQACMDFLHEHRVLVEPACGAALAVATQPGHPALQGATRVLVVVCGGVSATWAQLQAWQQTLQVQ
ncbi:pyridoxal-phosphate dependent enzyme [Ideonella sp. BN130291]|uniref:pyridoxal-phosphate dependent enzyme n=1 Tax=Ideonella sp. BN130291 TaxID=3112940 RepID=UPI002E2662BD|nr:pyridoxal-phosphate dependent enzyme [Ideonella sp. BN130291]